MQKIGPQTLLLFVAGALGATSVGCVDNNSSIFIHSVAFRDAENGCVCDAEPDNAALAAGFVDSRLSGGSGYTACLRVGNQMIRTTDENRLRVETSRVTLFEAEVETFDFNGNSINSFSQPIASFVDASQGNTPGFGAAFVTLIDPATLSAIDTSGGGQTVVARVKVFGETLGGADVESGPFDYPIQVCTNCIPCQEPEECDATPEPVCAFGQDYAPDCRCIEDPSNSGQNISEACPGPVISCG